MSSVLEMVSVMCLWDLLYQTQFSKQILDISLSPRTQCIADVLLEASFTPMDGIDIPVKEITVTIY